MKSTDKTKLAHAIVLADENPSNLHELILKLLGIYNDAEVYNDIFEVMCVLKLNYLEQIEIFECVAHIFPNVVSQIQIEVIKNLVASGFILGVDFSIDANGELMANQKTKQYIETTISNHFAREFS